MVGAASSASTSLQEYLKRYGDKNEEEEKKKKKRRKVKPRPVGVVVVDEDPVWQKPVKLEEEDDDSADEEKPLVDEDIEVKRMKRLELLRSRRPYGTISEDGSGWVPVSEAPKLSNLKDQCSDISPPRKNRARNDTPSPEYDLKPSEVGREGNDFSSPREPRRRYHTPSPEHDILPPQHLHWRSSEVGREGNDFSPPRQRRKHHHTPSPEHDMSPPRRVHCTSMADLSPPRQPRKSHHTPSAEPDISPPRRVRCVPNNEYDSYASTGADLSPPRKGKAYRMRDPSAQQSNRSSSENDASRVCSATDLFPPRNARKEPSSRKEQQKVGLMSGRDVGEENARAKKDQQKWFEDMNPSDLGRGAAAVYRDKATGKPISKEEFMKSRIKEKPKEIQLEWGKGLAQKREDEEKKLQLELEKEKPFARMRDDPDLDKMLKERVRWGDPMAHLVKRKQSEPVLPDLGDDEKMRDSGFMIPQDIPSHSWLKRGLDAPPNRYGIKPGRHWDGVDRSNGYERELFKRMNEKAASEREAYLWSVSDM